MTGFTPIESLFGGLLIGAAASLLLLGNGRIAGVSGIAEGSILGARDERAWRALFVLGLVGGGLLLFFLRPATFEASAPMPLGRVALAGLAVGVGTRLANGCTSGHGVCGLARRSKRSLVATLVFMAAGVVTVFIVRHVFGASA